MRRKARAMIAIEVRELALSRAKTPQARMREEARRLLAALGNAPFVLLDRRGEMLSSEDWAKKLGARKSWRMAIAGPDGADPELFARAAEVWSLSRLTLPHRLARLIAVEQWFRAAAILCGHPYHRGA